MKIFVEIEKTSTGYCAHAPAILGCVAAGATLEETEQLIAEALQMHLNLEQLPDLEFKICA